jgi:dihydrofolate reductase
MKAIFACDDKGGIGKDGKMPWPKCSVDLQRFKSLTVNGIVVMGRGTWEAGDMPTPLPKRRNVVISSTEMDLPYDVIRFNDTSMLSSLPTAWIIGGAKLINSLLDDIDEIFITRFPGDYDCDTFIDLEYINNNFTASAENTFDDHTFQYLVRIENES